MQTALQPAAITDENHIPQQPSQQETGKLIVMTEVRTEETPAPAPPKKPMSTEEKKELMMNYLYKPGQHVGLESNMLSLKHAYTWLRDAAKTPVPDMLFSEFWHEGEICILFADTNTGKSLLAVQIADSISRGEAIPGFKMQAQKQPVLYFDFELSQKQFENRYSLNYTDHYAFDPNFLRIELNHDAGITANKSFEEQLCSSITQTIEITGAKVLIIDNITFFRDGGSRSKNAKPLMRELKAMKSKYGLSILAVAHTGKKIQGKPIGRGDVQGSRMLMSFCDSAFCIGESVQDKTLRYIKQVKNRATTTLYGKDNVCVCRLSKPNNFLGFELTGYSAEGDHLAEQLTPEQQHLALKIQSLAGSGQTHRQIAAQLHVSLSTVGKYLKKEKIAGNDSNVSNDSNSGNISNAGNNSNSSNESNDSNNSNVSNTGNSSNDSNSGNSSNVSNSGNVSNDSNMSNSSNDSNVSNDGNMSNTGNSSNGSNDSNASNTLLDSPTE